MQLLSSCKIFQNNNKARTYKYECRPNFNIDSRTDHYYPTNINSTTTSARFLPLTSSISRARPSDADGRL